MRLLVLALLAALLGFSVTGCSNPEVPPQEQGSGPDPDPVVLASIALGGALTQNVGDTVQLVATGTYSDGSTAPVTTGVTWSSLDPAVADISSSGLVTAVAPGATTLKAVAGTKEATVGITVRSVPAVLDSISIGGDLAKKTGDIAQLAVTGSFSDGSTSPVTEGVDWNSSDEAVATVSTAGLVTALTPGTTTLQATVGSLSATAALTVSWTYEVSVRRTTYGIPHIKANDFGSLGYGYGYAHAEDNLCVLQDDLITVRGQRAKFFGPEGSYAIPANSSVADNVSSDFFWQFMATDAAWQNLKAKADPELAAVTQGFVDGYNLYIRELKAGGHLGRHAACRNADWLFEISEGDMYRRYFRLALLASSSVFADAIAELQPPSSIPVPTDAPAAAMTTERQRELLLADAGELKAFQEGQRDRFGSNMYALGKDAVGAGKQPIVFGNPHFPWTGTERLYISHLTIPGKIDVMGSSLYGVPAVLIGFTDSFAWSHTVSTAYRFTIYELTLNPLNPTQYLYDDEVRDMTAVPLSVEVKGEAEPRARTLYKSHYGPMMTITTSGQRILPWTNAKAYTMRDANAENDRLINQFARWNQATSLSQFIRLHKQVLGVPWVNTVASGPNGKAYYGDVTVVPHVTAEMLTTCAAHPIHDVVQQVAPGLPVLDGSRSACEWGDDTAAPDEDGDAAPAKGIFGPTHLPTLERDDWVHNCNDSHWLTNPAEPRTGFAPIIGAEGTARSLRTRLCIQQVARQLGADKSKYEDGTSYADGIAPYADPDGDKRFSVQELQDTVLSSQIYSAQIARDDVVASICELGTVAITPTSSEQDTGEPVDVTAACGVLANWSMRSNQEDVGSHIWREFIRRALPNPLGLGPNPAAWTTPFSAADAVNTPKDLNVASPLVQSALGRSVNQIAAAGKDLNATLGSLQQSGAHPGTSRISIFGGTGTEGAFTIVSGNNLNSNGYNITFGNSYIQTVTWEPRGAGFGAVAHGFITYSQSTDPANPHYADYTRAYSGKAWHRFPFHEDDFVTGAGGNVLSTIALER